MFHCKLVTLFIIYYHGPCISNFRGNNDHFPNILAYGTFYVLNNTYIQTNSCQNKFFCNLSWVGVVFNLHWLADQWERILNHNWRTENGTLWVVNLFTEWLNERSTFTFPDGLKPIVFHTIAESDRIFLNRSRCIIYIYFKLYFVI